MKQLIIPPYLKEGDHVEIVSPSGVIDRDIVLKAAKKLEASGLVVTIGKNAIVAAGSVVTKNVPADEIWGGAILHSLSRR